MYAAAISRKRLIPKSCIFAPTLNLYALGKFGVISRISSSNFRASKYIRVLDTNLTCFVCSVIFRICVIMGTALAVPLSLKIKD